MAESKPSVSFSFTKKSDSSKLAESKLRDESTKDETVDTDFIKSLEGNKING